MSKRFTDTEKWKDEWFCSLTERERAFWCYLVDNCDHAGLWKVNWHLVEFYFPNMKSEFKFDRFEGKLVQLSEHKWFIKKFIDFQYGMLNPENRAHNSVLLLLEKEGLDMAHLSTINAPNKQLTRPIDGRKDKDKDKEQEQDPLETRFKHFENPAFKKAFSSYLKMRLKIRKPATEEAKELVLNKLQKHDVLTATAMLNQSVENSYQGVFELKQPWGKAGQPSIKQPPNPTYHVPTEVERDEVSKLIRQTAEKLHG